MALVLTRQNLRDNDFKWSPETNGGDHVLLGTPFLQPTDDSGNANILLAWCAPVVPRSGAITEIQRFVATPAGNLRGAIYDSDGANGIPGTLLAESDSILAAAGWVSLPLVTPVVTGQMIWICTNCDDNGLVTRISAPPSGGDPGPGYNIGVAQPYGAMPASFPGGGTLFYNLSSIYATLT